VGILWPKSKGGLNEIDNLRPICGTCNKSMGTTQMDEFVKDAGWDSKLLTEKIPIYKAPMCGNLLVKSTKIVNIKINKKQDTEEEYLENYMKDCTDESIENKLDVDDLSKIYKCVPCEYYTANKYSFERHIKKIRHIDKAGENAKEHNCKYCGEDFIKNSKLCKHIPLCAMRDNYELKIEITNKELTDQLKIAEDKNKLIEKQLDVQLKHSMERYEICEIKLKYSTEKYETLEKQSTEKYNKLEQEHYKLKQEYSQLQKKYIDEIYKYADEIGVREATTNSKYIQLVEKNFGTNINNSLKAPYPANDEAKSLKKIITQVFYPNN
jgi:5-methylcytosine-specific restriction endonuclease McrA